ncbi:hypothetical protein J6590_028325 [Homalodisca vitripennis]|nr:hypothetical protein J6590_028325 [Homalodisca vitripennis]
MKVARYLEKEFACKLYSTHETSFRHRMSSKILNVMSRNVGRDDDGDEPDGDDGSGRRDMLGVNSTVYPSPRPSR